MTQPIIHQAHKDQVFLRTDSSSVSYGQLYARQQSILQQIKPHPNPLILIIARNTTETVQMMSICWLSGIPFYAISPAIEDQEIPDFDDITHVFNTDNTKQYSGLPIISLPDLQEESAQPELAFSDDGYEFARLLTSGTTGRPKPITLMRRQMLHAIQAGSINFKPKSGDFWLLNLPLYHMGGINVVLRSLMFGSGIHLATGAGTKDMLPQILTFRDIRYLSLVPTQLKRLMESGMDGFADQLKGILLGGGPASADLISQARTAGLPVSASYGMTETCGQIAAQPIHDHSVPPDSVGKILDGNEIRIVNEQKDSCAAGESGMIQLRGLQVPELPNNGWFQTGDYGRLDDVGNLYVEARRADLIVSGGKNIRPYEIEILLEQYPQIRETAVIGEPDTEWGQIAVAVIVAIPGAQIQADDLKVFLRPHLPGWKIPKKWIIRYEPLPRTSLGKVKRSELP